MAGEAPPPRAEGPLTGRSVVITGGLEALSRDEAKRAVAAAGGKATESVSRKTSFVVAGRGAGLQAGQKAESLERPGRSTRRPSWPCWPGRRRRRSAEAG